MAALKIRIDPPGAREFEINGVTVSINVMDAAQVQQVYEARKKMIELVQTISTEDVAGLTELIRLTNQTAADVLGDDKLEEIWPAGCPGEYEAVQMLNALAQLQQIGRAAIYQQYAPARVDKDTGK